MRADSNPTSDRAHPPCAPSPLRPRRSCLPVGAKSRLRHVEKFDVAVEVLLPLASKSVLTTDTKAFLAVAMSAKRDDLVMEWCKALWESKALDAAARWNYLYLLDRYDPEDALRKTAYALEEEADPQESGALKARRVILQRRLGKPVVHITAVDVPLASSVQ